MTFRRRPTVDSPLGELIAGKINQAEYRRRIGRHPRRNAAMPDRAGLELRVDPEPVRRTQAPDDLGRPGMVFLWLGVVVVAIAVLVIVALASATPRGAQTTDLAPSRDLSAMPGPSAGLPMESRTQTGSRRPAGGGEAHTSPPATQLLALVTRAGDISHVGLGFPRDYLALPVNDGRRPLTVNLCGPADCVVLRQTDYGPSQRLHPDRIADVHPAVFERICGAPASTGVCPGTWTAISPTLPPTDGSLTRPRCRARPTPCQP